MLVTVSDSKGIGFYFIGHTRQYLRKDDLHTQCLAKILSHDIAKKRAFFDLSDECARNFVVRIFPQKYFQKFHYRQCNSVSFKLATHKLQIFWVDFLQTFIVYALNATWIIKIISVFRAISYYLFIHLIIFCANILECSKHDIILETILSRTSKCLGRSWALDVRITMHAPP